MDDAFSFMAFACAALNLEPDKLVECFLLFKIVPTPPEHVVIYFNEV
jgi:hypothetical protein